MPLLLSAPIRAPARTGMAVGRSADSAGKGREFTKGGLIGGFAICVLLLLLLLDPPLLNPPLRTPERGLSGGSVTERMPKRVPLGLGRVSTSRSYGQEAKGFVLEEPIICIYIYIYIYIHVYTCIDL